MLLSVGLAMLLGGAIGLEREASDKPAGLHTHMLVAGAAALVVALSDVMVQRFNTGLSGQLARSDLVIFLGAGTIIRRGPQRQVEGLTTAVSLLFTTAVGVCVALSQFLLAAGVTVMALVTLDLVARVPRGLE